MYFNITVGYKLFEKIIELRRKSGHSTTVANGKVDGLTVTLGWLKRFLSVNRKFDGRNKLVKRYNKYARMGLNYKTRIIMTKKQPSVSTDDKYKSYSVKMHEKFHARKVYERQSDSFEKLGKKALGDEIYFKFSLRKKKEFWAVVYQLLKLASLIMKGGRLELNDAMKESYRYIGYKKSLGRFVKRAVLLPKVRTDFLKLARLRII